MSRPAISAVVLAYNEERHLPACLATLDWADELLVVDSGSTDRTPEIARAAGARVEHRPFTHFGDQRQAALDMASGDWVFFVDADERVPAALAEEVRGAVARTGPEVGWWVPRRNFFWGHEVRYAGWAPDYQLRLLRKGHARYDRSALVHEVAKLDGPTGRLRTPLIHLNYDSWAEFWAKQRAYAPYEARRRRLQGQRCRPWTFLLQPGREFYRRFVVWRGYRDGRLGLGLCLLMACYEVLVCRHLWALQREREVE